MEEGRSAMYRRQGVLCVGEKECNVLEGRSVMCKREGVLCVGREGSSTMCRREGVLCGEGKERYV